MANMSYCQFRNTLGDLRDCEQAMAEQVMDEDLSTDEDAARIQLINLCIEIAKDYGPQDVSNALFGIDEERLKLN